MELKTQENYTWRLLSRVGRCGGRVRVRGKVKPRNKNQGKRKRTKKDDTAKTESVQSSQEETIRASSRES